MLEFQNKFNASSVDDYYDNPTIHLENVKNLNEKLYDLSEENNFLKTELQRLQNSKTISSLNNFQSQSQGNVQNKYCYTQDSQNNNIISTSVENSVNKNNYNYISNKNISPIVGGNSTQMNTLEINNGKYKIFKILFFR